MSSVNTAPYLGVNVGQTPINTPHNWALGNEDSDAADSAPNTGTLAGNVLLEETGPYTGGYLLGTPTHTPLRSKSVSPFLSHRIKGVGKGRGIRREGEKKAIRTSWYQYRCILKTSSKCHLPLLFEGGDLPPTP